MTELPPSAIASIPDMQLSKVSIEGMLGSFDAEYESIDTHPLALRTHHNERAPINRLPSEILLIVFSQVPRTPTVWGRNTTDSWHKNQWIYFTHVCRRWREIGLHSPLLWTQINTSSFDRFSAFLQRSLPAKVNVTCHFYEETDNIRFIDVLASHASRVHRLDVSFDIDYDGRMDFSSLSTLHMPNLEVFRLASEAEPGYPFDEDGVDFVEEEPDVRPFSPTWDEHGIHIQNLSLRFVAIPWTSKVFCDLRTLELDGQNAATEYTPSMETFLGVLQSCPQLEHLVVNYSGPADETSKEYLAPAWRPERRVELAHLRFLVLHNQATHIGYLLTHLIIPESAHVSLQCPAIDREGEGGGNNQLEQLVAVARELGSLKFLENVMHLQLSVKESVDNVDVDGYGSNGNHILHIRVYWNMHSHDVDPSLKPSQAFLFMRRTFSKYPIQQLTVVSDSEHIDSECWHTTLRCIPSIRNLAFISDAFNNSGDIEETPIGRFLRALDTDISATTSPSPILPQLSQLSLRQLYVNDSFGIALKDVLVNRARVLGCLDKLSVTYWGSANKPLPSFPDLDGLVRAFQHGESPSPVT